MTNSTQSAYHVPAWNKAARILFKPVFRGIFHLLARVKVTGAENVPYGKPYVVAINHLSLFDPPLALAFWPEMVEAMGAVDIWNKPGQGQLVRMYHAIPVHRGEYDRELFDKVLSVLASGRPLLLAPEGGRSHSIGMKQARPGVAYIIEKAGVPVVPVGIVGTTDDFFKKAIKGERRLLEMNIGEPFLLPPVSGKGEDRREGRQKNADLVMSKIAALLPAEYRGYYG
ncbi:MAG: lysophospholipid acyltransferase family protein [Chloroflexota bacterium]